MTDAQAHNRILTQAARRVLGPLGVRQRGRSRMWFDDHGWWLIGIEFQPSSWSKGAYLNVGAMWLWQRNDGFAFDFGYRVEGHREFRDEASFAGDAEQLAKRAADEVLRYRAMFPDITAVADILQQHASGHGWTRYHAGIAAALANRSRRAAAELGTLDAIRGDVPWRQELRALAAELRAALAQPEMFRARIATIVHETRSAMKLPPWDGQLPSVADVTTP